MFHEAAEALARDGWQLRAARGVRRRLAVSMGVALGALGIAMLGNAHVAQAAGINGCQAPSTTSLLWSGTSESCNDVETCYHDLCAYSVSVKGNDLGEIGITSARVQAFPYGSGVADATGSCPVVAGSAAVNSGGVSAPTAGACSASLAWTLHLGQTETFHATIVSAAPMLDPLVRLVGNETDSDFNGGGTCARDLPGASHSSRQRHSHHRHSRHTIRVRPAFSNC